MSKTTISIGAPVAKPDEYGRTEHPVAVRFRGQDHSARVVFAIVNAEVPYGVGECSDESFTAIVSALESKGRGALRSMVEQARAS